MKSYDVAARTMRWVCIALVLLTYPFSHNPTSIMLLTLLGAGIFYNLAHYLRPRTGAAVFTSRMNTLAIDHLFVFGLIVLTGGLESTYYPLVFLLIAALISNYGLAGFSFAISSQLAMGVIVWQIHVSPAATSTGAGLVVKLTLLLLFSFMLEDRFSRQAEGERQRLLALINSISSAVLAIDEHGKIYLYNAAALELLNTNRSIAGLAISNVLPLHDAHDHRVNILQLIAHGDRPLSRGDLTYHASDGSNIILDLTLTPVRAFGTGTDHRGGYMVVFRDITKQKSLDEERSEFIAVTSHELRTPLAIAEANLSTAMLPSFAKLPAKIRPLLDESHNNIVFLSQLIQDLSTLARAERDQLNLSHDLVDVGGVAEQLVRDYHDQARAKRLKLELEAEPDLGSIVTSQMELREILQNLITNAIKYTPKGSITLSVKRAKTGLEFAVSDTGIGISASDKPMIFTKFYRSEDYRTRATGGTGLGLYITHKLAEKLGARITFTSKLNHGSTFTLTLPQTNQASEDPVAAKPAPVAAT